MSAAPSTTSPTRDKRIWWILMSKKQVLGLPFSKGGLDAFAPCNLKGKSRCRFAVGAVGCHKADNHKSQDRSRKSEPHITPRRLTG